MAKNTGTLVTAKIKKYDSLDTYKVADASDVEVVEQNGVVGTDVQSALENLVAGDAIIDKTVAEVRTMMGGTLVEGQRYKVPYIAEQNDTNYPSIRADGSTEHLILRATSTTTLSSECQSVEYPDDVVHYDISKDTYGRVIYRHNITYNVSAFEDFRAFEYERFNDGTGNYHLPERESDLIPDMNDKQWVRMFPTLSLFSNVHVGCPMDRGVTYNTTFGATGGRNIVIDDGGTGGGSGFAGANDAVHIETQVNGVIIGSGVNHIALGSCSDHIRIIAINANNITVGNGTSHITIIGSSCYAIHIGGDAGWWTIDSAGYVNIDDGHNGNDFIITVSGTEIGQGKIWPINYSQLYNGVDGLVDLARLIPGQKYRITDRGNAVVEAQSVSTYSPYKDCVATISPAAGILDLTDQVANEITVDGDITSITPVPAWSIIIKTSVAMTLTGTAYESISANGQIMMQGTITLDPLYGDFVELVPQVIDNGTAYTVWKIKSRSIYE